MLTEEVKAEFEVVKAIYPEAKVSEDGSWCDIAIPIELEDPIELKLSSQGSKCADSLTISNLTPLKCHFALPDGYPAENPPTVSITGGKGWINEHIIDRITSELLEIWNMSHEVVLYSYIDKMMTMASLDAFGIVDTTTRSLTVGSKASFETLAAADRHAKKQHFDSEMFQCGICLMEKPGSESVQFESCHHVFCRKCLAGYFKSNIKSGSIDKIHCPDVKCTELFVKKMMSELDEQIDHLTTQDLAKFEKRYFTTPVNHEMLSSIVEDDVLVNRYEDLFKKEHFDRYMRAFPQRVAICPEKTCKTPFLRENDDEKLAICPRCHFAFCVVCLHSWHGNANSCRSVVSTRIPAEDLQLWIDNEDPESLTRKNLAFRYGRRAMELAVEEYQSDQLFEQLVQSNESDIVRCPGCSLPIQRSDGCNKMTCSRCLTMFCNICGTILSKQDPYAHFNDPACDCYGRLFEGMKVSVNGVEERIEGGQLPDIN